MLKLKLPSKFSVCRLGIILALALFAQSSFGAEDKPTPLPPEPDAELIPVKPKKKETHEELPAPAETQSRYQDRYPKFSTVQTAFARWSQQDNQGIIGQISAEKWQKMAKWMSKIIDYRGVLDTDACSSKDAASSELRSALNFCFGVSDGEAPAAVYRLVQALKAEEVDATEIRSALKEVNLCRTALKKMADGKRRKLGDRKGRSPMDWELDLDNIQPLLTTLEGIQVAEASASPSPAPAWSPRTRAEECIIYHRDCYQQRLDETPLDKMCLLGDKPAEVVSAHPTPVKESNVVPPPVQEPTPNQPVPQPVPNQPVAQPQPAPVPQPVPNYPAMPLPVAKNYGPAPCTGCGGYRRAGGGGVVGGGAGGVVGGGAVVPVARGGVSVGVGVGPTLPPPFPPYPPRPMVPVPPIAMPIVMGGGAVAGGPVGIPSVGGATVVASKTTVSISSGAPMPMMNMCMKGCPKGFMGMGGMRPPMVNPLMRPYPPRPGYPPTMRPPMVTPYYPGMPNTGNYGPITTTSPYQTPSVSPYVNPTFYTQTQPQTQYGPIAPYRGSVGRI